jgi:hypothetical protein
MSDLLLEGLLYMKKGDLPISEVLDYSPFFGCEAWEFLDSTMTADSRDVELVEQTLRLTARGRLCVQMHGSFLSRALRNVLACLRLKKSGSPTRVIRSQRLAIGRLQSVYGRKVNLRYALQYYKNMDGVRELSKLPFSEVLRLLKRNVPREELVPQISLPKAPSLYPHYRLTLEHLSALVALARFQDMTVPEAVREAAHFGLTESEMRAVLSQLVYFGHVEVKGPVCRVMTLNQKNWAEVIKKHKHFFDATLGLFGRAWLDSEKIGAINTQLQKERVRRNVRAALRETLETGRLPTRVSHGVSQSLEQALKRL